MAVYLGSEKVSSGGGIGGGSTGGGSTGGGTEVFIVTITAVDNGDGTWIYKSNKTSNEVLDARSNGKIVYAQVVDDEGPWFGFIPLKECDEYGSRFKDIIAYMDTNGTGKVLIGDFNLRPGSARIVNYTSLIIDGATVSHNKSPVFGLV